VVQTFNAFTSQLLGGEHEAILSGDYKVVPTNQDIYNAGSWRFDAVLQPETRSAFQQLLAQGWTDCARHLYPEGRKELYTFWVNEYAFQRNAGFRMDFVLISPGLVGRLRQAGVVAQQRGMDRPSDHAPVWVDPT